MKVLVVYKKSARHGSLAKPQKIWRSSSRFIQRDQKRLRLAQRAHQNTLEIVKRILRKKGIAYRAVYQAREQNYAPYRLVIAVGGDGTFLEAARQVRHHPILGVNSDPERSAGTFCAATQENFESILTRILQGKSKMEILSRFQLVLNGKALDIHALNDLMVTHERPAAMSRYWLKVGHRAEEQRSSGLWISTAAGSTGAIRSAGGKVFHRTSRLVQYRPRELYSRVGVRYRLTGGTFSLSRNFQVGSLMPKGLICVDGDHWRFGFGYGDLLELKPSPYPIHLILG